MAYTNWRRTHSTVHSIVLMQIMTGANHQDDTLAAADDVHLTIGKSSSHPRVGRAEIRIPEPDDWPAAGRLVSATLTVTQSGTEAHDDFRGGSPGLLVLRMTEAAKFGVPPDADGHGADRYSTKGSGDKFPGGNVAAEDATDQSMGVQFKVDPGKTAKNVTRMVEAMMPARILKRDGTAGGDELYGYFQLRSTDEGSSSRSSVLSRTVTLTIEVDTRVVPGAPTILRVVGTDPDSTSSPAIVATADGKTLEVEFAFAAGPNETCSKAVLELYGEGAIDPPPLGEGPLGKLIRTTGQVTPTKGTGTNVYLVKMTDLWVGAVGKFRLSATSSSGKQGPFTSVDDAKAHIKTAVIPAAPTDVVVLPWVDAPHVLASMSGTTDTITRIHSIWTLIPEGRNAEDQDSDVGGATRRADQPYNGIALRDGQQVSVTVRLMNQDGIWSRWSSPVRQTMRVRTGPTLTPSPGRLTTRTPTFTIAASTFDGWRLRLIHESDDTIVYYDSGADPGDHTVVNQTSVNVAIPANTLAWGQRFRAIANVVPDTLTEYGEDSQAQPYSIAALPVTTVTIPGARSGLVPTRDPLILRTVTDPDGATLEGIDMVINAAASPAGSGTRITRRFDPDALALTRTGMVVDTLEASAGWVGDTQLAVDTYIATFPTGYSNANLRVTASAVASTRSAVKVGDLDLSGFGEGTYLRVWSRVTSVTNLTNWRLAIYDADNNGWSWDLATSGTSLNTWAESTLPLHAPDHSTASDPDLSAITYMQIQLVPSASYTGEFAIRDLRIGTVDSDANSPAGGIAWEESVDIEARAVNDTDDIATTTLSSGAARGATTLSMTSESGFAAGQAIIIGGPVPEVRDVTSIGPVTFGSGLEAAHPSGASVVARAFGPNSAWVTITAARPPDVDLVTPVDGATVTRPWQTLDWSVTEYGGRTRASAVVWIYDAAGKAIWAQEVGTATSMDVPAYLLDTLLDYSWKVVVTDSGGMTSTSATRTFSTSFVEPEPALAISAEPALDASAVDVAWDLPDDADLHHVEVFWYDDMGTPVRIDGGPEALGDGRPAFTGRSLVHIGARLGTNAYSVVPHNGWRGTDPIGASAYLPWSDLPRGAWEAVTSDLTVMHFRVSDVSYATDAMIDAMQPPGAENRAISWGIGARRISMRNDTIPGEDSALATTLRALMADPVRGRLARPAWIKAPPGYGLDPVWCLLTGSGTTPAAGGMLGLSPEWLEVGDPVRSVLIQPPATPPGIAEIYASEEEYDWGTIQVGEEV